MTNTTTETTSDYLPGEALTASTTAREWVQRFEPGVIQFMDDEARAFAEITERDHAVAQRLSLPRADHAERRRPLNEDVSGRNAELSRRIELQVEFPVAR